MDEPYDKVRAARRAQAGATGSVQRARTWYVVGFVGLVGAFMLLNSVLYFSGWSLAGALVWIAAVVPLLRAESRRVETVERTDLPAHRAEMGWWIGGIVLLALGVLLTVHPW